MYAAPVPTAIRLNIFRWRVRKDFQPRSSSGQPHHRTAGVASVNCTQFQYGAMAPNQTALLAVNICAIETVTNGNASTTLTQKRRVMDASSAFSSGAASSVRVRGSSAMPQIGHAPGLSLSTSGSIGQMYSTLVLEALRGPLCCADACAGGLAICIPAWDACASAAMPPSWIRPGLGAFRYFPGSAWNFCSHPVHQKSCL